MLAFITSIGEKTTELCKWSLERNGFETCLILSENSLAEKLRHIYIEAQDDFVRIDADCVVNRNLLPPLVRQMSQQEHWWTQFLTFDWHKQDTTTGGVQFIRREALPALRDNIGKFIDSERPETEISRIKDFYNPRRFASVQTIVGIHGYKASDVERIRQTKVRRGQDQYYDWELAERLDSL